jgi:hypothetical protein
MQLKAYRGLIRLAFFMAFPDQAFFLPDYRIAFNAAELVLLASFL